METSVIPNGWSPLTGDQSVWFGSEVTTKRVAPLPRNRSVRGIVPISDVQQLFSPQPIATADGSYDTSIGTSDHPLEPRGRNWGIRIFHRSIRTLARTPRRPHNKGNARPMHRPSLGVDALSCD
jgi:hypothetical protein